jgi:hypothetical protein
LIRDVLFSFIVFVYKERMMNIRDAFIMDHVEEKKMWNKKRIGLIKKKDN